MLRPQNSATRDARRLDGLWSFTHDPLNVGRTEQWWSAPLPNAVLLPVPSSFNDVLAQNELRSHLGDVWYQRTLVVPFGWTDQRMLLRFDAATHRATVWIDDTLVVEHEGGYLPFEADLTESLEPGTTARRTVCLNN